MAEAGVPGYDLDFWFGIVAPAGTPRAIVEQLSREIGEIEKVAAFRQRLSAFANLQLETSGPDALSAIIKRDIVLWQKRLREAGVQPQ